MGFSPNFRTGSYFQVAGKLYPEAGTKESAYFCFLLDSQMTDGEFREFLRSSASLLAANSEQRSMHFICMDFRTTRKRSILCLP
jgi:hypothetical protein